MARSIYIVVQEDEPKHFTLDPDEAQQIAEEHNATVEEYTIEDIPTK